MSLTWLAATPRTPVGRPRAAECAVVVVSAVADHHQGALAGSGPVRDANAIEPGVSERAAGRGEPDHPGSADSC